MKYTCFCGYETDVKDEILSHGEKFDDQPKFVNGRFRMRHSYEQIKSEDWNSILSVLNDLMNDNPNFKGPVLG